MSEIEKKAEECALCEGIDPNFDLRDLQGGAFCPHGTPYSFKRIYQAGFRAALAEALPLIKRCHEDQMGFPLWDDLKAFLEKYEGETK